MRAYGTEAQIWGGSPDCDHTLDPTPPGKVLTGGTGTASAKQVTNAGSQYGNAWVESVKPGVTGGTNARALWNGVQYTTASQPVQPSTVSATCTRCGAWRGELGSESRPDCLAWARGVEPCSVCFVCHLVTVFRAVRRVLHPTGTCWVNLGDSYSGSGKGGNPPESPYNGIVGGRSSRQKSAPNPGASPTIDGLGPKQLLMMPARVALALQADGWVLRSAITWAKKSSMPESVRDRPTNATEMVYLLAKQPTYFYDAEAVRQPLTAMSLYHGYSGGRATKADGLEAEVRQFSTKEYVPTGANLRNFWLLGPEPYSAAHFATFPRKLVEPCVLAGTSARGCCSRCRAPWERVVERGALEAEPGYENTERVYAKGMNATEAQHRGANFIKDGFQPNRRYPQTTTGWRPTCRCEGAEVIPCTVLDPFLGSGTTAYVARHHGRRAVGIELSESYAKLAADRLKQGTLGLEVY